MGTLSGHPDHKISHDQSMYWVSQKNVWCRKLQEFSNDAIYQCNILRHGPYNLSLGVCKVSIQYVKKATEVMITPETAPSARIVFIQ